MLQGKKAYICSPLSAPNPEGMQHNMELAKYYLMQMKRLYHCRTFASHAHLPLAHYLSGDTFICVAGVNQYRNLKPVLETLKSRHLQHLYEAYDMDKKMKVYCDGDSEKCDACQRKPATFYCPHKMQKRQILQNACRKVYEICSGLSISMSRMVWDMSILNQMPEERCKGAYYWAIRKIRKRMGGKRS